MRLRSAFLSPPAVAGLALLAAVIGIAFAIRLTGGGNGTDTTDVAGAVIERDEPTELDEPVAPPVDDEPIVVPLDEEPAGEEDEDEAEAPAPAAPAPPAPAEEPAPPVGLVREPGPAPGTTDDTTTPGGNDDTTDEDEEPTETPDRPRPRQPQETEPPSPTPTPADVALRPGEGHSRDTALAEEGDWLIREVSGHGGPGTETSREAAARLTVGFNDEARFGSGGVRSFSCQAWLTAGDERLTTDRDHVFEISLVTLDDNGAVASVVTSVIERHAYDLAPGETTQDQRMSTTPVELDAADETDYSCVAIYRER